MAEPGIVKQLRSEEKNGLLQNPKNISKVIISKEDSKHNLCQNHQQISFFDNNKRFQAIVEDISDWIWEVDRNGVYSYSNPKVKDLLGYQPNDIMSKTVFDFMPIDEAKRIRATFQACVELKNPIIRLENKNKHKNGEIVVFETSGVPIIDSQGYLKGFRGITRDVTDRKKNEEELYRKNKQLAEINKELENYSYIISHDLKEPLRSIQVFSGFLLEEFSHELNDTAMDYITRIQNASLRMNSLITDLLKLSKIGMEQITYEEIELNTLLHDVQEDLSGIIIEKNAEINIEPLPKIYGNQTLISELFKNLISNGIKFCDQKPCIFIRCDEQEEEYLFRISDNGIGIEGKFLTKIFDGFTRIHPHEKYKGTGLGLLICKKIVDRHNGKIWVESKVGNGCTFFVLISKYLSIEHKKDSKNTKQLLGVVQ